MNDDAKAARRAYKRAWNRANPDKVKAAQERYWTRRAEREKAEKENAEALPEATPAE